MFFKLYPSHQCPIRYPIMDPIQPNAKLAQSYKNFGPTLTYLSHNTFFFLPTPILDFSSLLCLFHHHNEAITTTHRHIRNPSLATIPIPL